MTAKQLKAIALPLFVSTLFFNQVNAQNAALQADAALYQVKCTQCHPIEMAKVVNGQVLPSEVYAMTKRMQELPGSLMSVADIQPCYQFAMYDIYANQRAELKARLASLSPEEKKKEINALKQALAKYK